MPRKIKIGIDVGGTFTHAVAVDTAGLEIVGKACVPTTHSAQEGVARGVVESLQLLLDENRIGKEEVVLIAHSTTQATNALLEGDVAKVGVIGMGIGFEGKIASRQINPAGLELAPGKMLPTSYRYMDVAHRPDLESITRAINELAAEDVEVIVASQAFGIDDLDNEKRVVAAAKDLGYLASAASEISKLYGLRIRTRTAVINASMMPRMLETANMTEQAVRETGIKAPLMIMRSDGGIMDIEQMRQRPILTMLSGPAAGVAAALMYVKMSDGIFIEVGGTSSDISVIKNGKPQIRSAQIAGNKLYLKTLDVRTLGIAGGSVPRIKNKQIIDVGPRSAHIANLDYASFADIEDASQLEMSTVQPIAGDPDDYLKLTDSTTLQKGFTVTPTGASHILDLASNAGHGAANTDSLQRVFQQMSALLNTDAKSLATNILQVSTDKIRPVIRRLQREYKLDPAFMCFVGGGGGAPALVPFLSQSTNIPHSITENCEVVSAIGAALGIIRDTVERSIVDPGESDLLKIRKEAMESVQAMGAIPESIEVSIEIDNRNQRVLAIATGSSEMRQHDSGASAENIGLESIAATALRSSQSAVKVAGQTSLLTVFSTTSIRSVLFGLWKSRENRLCVLGSDGIIRLQRSGCTAVQTEAHKVMARIRNFISELTSFGDGGSLIPDLFVLVSGRIIDLTGLMTVDQILPLINIELEKYPADSPVVIIAAPRLQ